MLFMYSIFAHQFLRHTLRSVSAKFGQIGPDCSRTNHDVWKNIMNMYTGVKLEMREENWFMLEMNT